MVVERAREIAVHEQGVEVERDIETKGESIGHEVEIDIEGLVAKIGTDREAERDQGQRTAKMLWKPKMKTELAMKKDR